MDQSKIKITQGYENRNRCNQECVIDRSWLAHLRWLLAEWSRDTGLKAIYDAARPVTVQARWTGSYRNYGANLQ